VPVDQSLLLLQTAPLHASTDNAPITNQAADWALAALWLHAVACLSFARGLLGGGERRAGAIDQRGELSRLLVEAKLLLRAALQRAVRSSVCPRH
jgi:hypothetical protein